MVLQLQADPSPLETALADLVLVLVLPLLRACTVDVGPPAPEVPPRQGSGPIDQAPRSRHPAGRSIRAACLVSVLLPSLPGRAVWARVSPHPRSSGVRVRALAALALPSLTAAMQVLLQLQLLLPQVTLQVFQLDRLLLLVFRVLQLWLLMLVSLLLLAQVAQEPT